MTQLLILDLPDDVYQYLREVATLTHQSMEELVEQSVKGNLPPRIADAPVDMQTELLEMRRLSERELRQIANGQIPLAQQLRHQALLEKNAEGIITPKERSELDQLRRSADQQMLRKAYAWALLRWRGYPMPALDDLPVN